MKVVRVTDSGERPAGRPRIGVTIEDSDGRAIEDQPAWVHCKPGDLVEPYVTKLVYTADGDMYLAYYSTEHNRWQTPGIPSAPVEGVTHYHHLPAAPSD